MPTSDGQLARLARVLRETPAAVPAFLALALFVTWAGSEDGYPVTHWAPGGLILLALLAITVLGARPRLRQVSPAGRIALACLALYAALGYLSILWAQVPGDAWEGANRTLLYVLVFALFSLWPMRGSAAALLLCAWVLAMMALAAYVLLHVDGARSTASLFSDGRLKFPAGYENAAAACWCMAMWPALLLARSRQIPPLLRGVLAGGAVLFGDVALLSQSRGSLFATVIMLVLVFALLPGRVRTFLVVAAVSAGIAVTTPAVLHVGDRLLDGGDVKAAMHAATLAVLLAAAVVGLLIGAGAGLERRDLLSERSLARFRASVAGVAGVALVCLLAGGWIAAGNPVARAEHAWQTFKHGYSANDTHVNRLVGGLGSGRYDFYRVALDEFVAHPLVGIGADNFQPQYLAHARTEETPHYPHSVELRTLVQGGVVGALIGLAGLTAALVCAGAALKKLARRRDPLGAAVAAAALGGFVYWLAHGSVDWFWEFAGLGAPAFALLGIACGLGCRAARAESPGTETAVGTAIPAGGAGSRRALAIAAALVLAAGVGGVAFALPWLSRLQVENATRIWTTAPRAAYAKLEDAAGLNPLSAEPYLLEGSIALRFADLARADRAFSRALSRDRTNAYATLERGAIASALGDRSQALQMLERAVQLSPRDEVIQKSLSIVRKGQRLSIEELNQAIFAKARQLA